MEGAADPPLALFTELFGALFLTPRSLTFPFEEPLKGQSLSSCLRNDFNERVALWKAPALVFLPALQGL